MYSHIQVITEDTSGFWYFSLASGVDGASKSGNEASHDELTRWQYNP